MRFAKLLVAVYVFLTQYCLAQSFATPEVHPGTTFAATVDRSIRASHSRTDDRAAFKVAQPFLLAGEVVPAGATVTGHVVIARKGDKKAKLDWLLAVVTDKISWKKKSTAVKAWIVGFGSVKVSASNAAQYGGMRLDPRIRAIMAETTDRPSSAHSGGVWAPEAFEGGLPRATVYDPAGFVRDIRIVRKPNDNVGTLLLHDDGDIYLPKGLLVLMEQIEVAETGSSAAEENR